MILGVWSATLPQSDCVWKPVSPLCDFYCQAIPPTRAKSADRQTRDNYPENGLRGSV